MADATMDKVNPHDLDAREQELYEVRWDTLDEVKGMIEDPYGLQHRAHLMGVELESTPEDTPPQKMLATGVVVTYDDGTVHYEIIRSDDDVQHRRKISAAVEYFTAVRPYRSLKLADIKKIFKTPSGAL